MKKIRLVIVSMICLVATLVVSSFAWFSIGNNGIFSEGVETDNQLIIDFAAAGSNKEAMMPAKLKKGVINSPQGTITGQSERVPMGMDVLPKHDSNWHYVVENDSLVSQSEYLETPATIVYSQFELTLESNSDSGYKDLEFSFVVKYYNVDQVKDGELKTPIAQLPVFNQMDALAFNFFVVEDKGLTQEQLDVISTNKGSARSNRTIEEFMVAESEKEENEKVKFHSKDQVDHLSQLNLESPNIENDIKNVIYNNYRYSANATSTNEKDYYSVSITNLEVNKKYFILLESYYNLPDAMVEGNLPLTGQFVLDISYTPRAAIEPPQN